MTGKSLQKEHKAPNLTTPVEPETQDPTEELGQGDDDPHGTADNQATEIVSAWKRILGIKLSARRVRKHLESLAQWTARQGATENKGE